LCVYTRGFVEKCEEAKHFASPEGC
jgi:hypothetical protein